MDHHHSHSSHGGHGGLGVHGMLVVGSETVFLSHLPMFGDPAHGVQAILEATFSDGGNDPQSVYADDRARTGTRMYTLQPERFVLSDLVSPDGSQPPPRRSFRATVHRGHFERNNPPTPILREIEVEVTDVIYFQGLDPDAPGLPRLEYLLFGKGDEMFVAHVISRPPDFDQVLSVEVAGHEFTDDELRRGVRTVVPDRANSMSERIREGEKLAAEARLEGDSRAVGIQVRAGVEFYFEEGELREVPTFEQTPEEIAAGFG